MNRPKIIEAYMVPAGNVSPDIFKLPCVIKAQKLPDGDTLYMCITELFGNIWASEGNYICKLDDGRWILLTAEDYDKYNLTL